MDDIIIFNERSMRLLKENDDYFEFYNNLVKSMWKYANFLMNESNEIRKLKSKMDQYGAEWYRNEIKSLDQTRRIIHNNAIDNINIANRCCLRLNIPIIYDGECDDNHREIVADSICNYYRDILYHNIDNYF